MQFRSLIIGFAACVLIILVGVIIYSQTSQPTATISGTSTQVTVTRTIMNLTSSVFENNQEIPRKYTCDAEDVSPPLSISEVPADAKSLVLIVDDPDAPVGDWVHWTAWNIPASTTEIREGSAPTGIEGTTDFGRTGWGGPCPPSGTHRYFFKLFALDTELDLDASAKKTDILNALEGHVLDKTELIGLYQRS